VNQQASEQDRKERQNKVQRIFPAMRLDLIGEQPASISNVAAPVKIGSLFNNSR